MFIVASQPVAEILSQDTEDDSTRFSIERQREELDTLKKFGDMQTTDCGLQVHRVTTRTCSAITRWEKSCNTPQVELATSRLIIIKFNSFNFTPSGHRARLAAHCARRNGVRWRRFRLSLRPTASSDQRFALA